MGSKLFILFGCLAYVTCRTVTLEKTSLSLTENSEDADDLGEILQAFLGDHDITSGLQNGDVGGCSKGKCQFCKKVMKHDACFIASLGKNSITIEVTLNKKDVMKKVITVPNPPAVCKKSIPGIPMVKDVCVQVKNIDLKKASGCVYISFKVSVKKISIKIACFTIPHDDIEIGGESDVTVEAVEQNEVTEDSVVEGENSDVESIDLEDGTLKFQPFSNKS